MPRSEFDRNMAALAGQLGRGRLVGKIECDQVYARYQHEGLHLRHPHGGGPKFLSGTLMQNHADYLGELAERTIVPAGSNLHEAMENVVEKWSKDAAKETPIEWGDLRNSMHPTVTQGRRMLYDRAPLARRLTAEELETKRRWRV